MASRTVGEGRTLIAGGTGLIGANLTRYLLDSGWDVVPTYWSGRPSFAHDRYRQYDFRNFQDCLDATRSVQNVFLCAAQNYVEARDKGPSQLLYPNLAIYAGLFEACYRNGVQKVLFMSSSTVYQESNRPIAEDEIDLNQPPHESYDAIGWLYRYIEKMAQFYSMKCGLQTGIARLSYVYGPWDTLDAERMHVIPALIHRALSREIPYRVWGDGDTVREFLYVDDLIQDLIGLLDRYCVAEPINIGTGEGRMVRELVGLILNTCQHPAEPEFDRTMGTGVPYRVLNVARSSEVLGERKRTPLSEGIRKTVEWYEARR